MKTLDHPNLLALIGYEVTEEELILTLPLCSGRTLESFIRNESSTLSEKLSIMRQILNGLQYLHGLGIIHGRIRPRLIFLEDSNSRPLVKLSDFKLSLDFKEADRRFIAPELIKSAPLQDIGRSDVYSAGICFSDMLKGIPL